MTTTIYAVVWGYDDFVPKVESLWSTKEAAQHHADKINGVGGNWRVRSMELKK